MTTYLLQTGSDYEPWPRCRLTEDQASILRLTPLHLPDGAQVVEYDDPPDRLVLEPTGTYARAGVTICWDGSVPGHAANLNEGTEAELVVEHRCRLTAGAIVVEPEECPTELSVKRWRLDLDYKPMVTLVVEGPDPDEVRARFLAERAEIEADPVGAVLGVWRSGDGAVGDRLAYFLGRPENVELDAAVRSGRYDSIIGRA